MNDRRNFLKLFGAGATIIPVIAGVPEIAAPVKLIEEAKFEPVKMMPVSAPQLPTDFNHSKVHVTVDIVDGSNKHFRFTANSFIVDVKYKPIIYHGYPGLEYSAGIPARREVHWHLHGICEQDNLGNVFTIDQFWHED